MISAHASGPVESDPPLLFDWVPPKGEKVLITIFLFGSLLLHGIAFYLFRIIYPPAVALLPPPARVNVIAPNSEQGKTLLRWIEAEDPALAFATLRPTEMRLRALPKLEHVPSYMVQKPQLKQPPPFSIPIPAVEAFPPGPVFLTPLRPEPPRPKLSTRVSFSDEFSPFGDLKLPQFQFTASAGEPPESVQFRVAVNRNGEIRYCFPMNSSGDAALDEQARMWLIRSRFSSAHAASPLGLGREQDLVWGIATIDWGNDISQPFRNSTPNPP
jgi:hypothetical protein